MGSGEQPEAGGPQGGVEEEGGRREAWVAEGFTGGSEALCFWGKLVYARQPQEGMWWVTTLDPSRV